MGRKKCKCECQKCLPAWLAAFGDLMSLLLCFFVLLLSMSTMDAKKVSDAIGSLSGALSVLEGGIKTEVSRERIQQATPLESTTETTDSVNRIAQTIVEANEMVTKGGGPAVTVEEAEEGYVIKLPAALLFQPGSAKVENSDSILFLKRIAMIMATFPSDIQISVRGHTDDGQPGLDSPFKDNWELSSARAISVLKILIDNGVLAERTHAAGFGEFKPVATNTTPEGREKNRRVEIHFVGRKNSSESVVKDSVLDQAPAQ
jgi:chemotaxis protein MotB